MKRSPLRPISARRLAELQRDGQRPGLERRTRISPGAKRLTTRTRINPVNRKRRAKAFVRNFGAKRAWIVSLDCVVPGCWRRPVDPAHVKSVGARGTSADLVALCAGPDGHHREQHDHGIKTFQAKYGLDLPAIAAKLEATWQERAPAALIELEAQEREAILAAELEARWHGKGSE